jgi:predicted DNA-binding WGR domain protein
MRYWVNHETRRYYRAFLQQDLFGDWTMVRCWGGLDSRLGQYRIERVANYDEGLAAIEDLDERRRKRGYVRAGEAVDGPSAG